MNKKHYIFGYGSLVDVNELKLYVGATDVSYEYISVKGLKRNWSVAMDNQVDLPNYKYYLNTNNERPSIFVSFLNVEFDKASSINGVVFSVDEAKLLNLDKRERNYNRVDISHLFNEKYPGTVWTYMGKAESINRFKQAKKEEKVVIQKDYMDFVIDAFKSVGYHFFFDYIKTTDFDNIPIINLKRQST